MPTKQIKKNRYMPLDFNETNIVDNLKLQRIFEP